MRLRIPNTRGECQRRYDWDSRFRSRWGNRDTQINLDEKIQYIPRVPKKLRATRTRESPYLNTYFKISLRGKRNTSFRWKKSSRPLWWDVWEKWDRCKEVSKSILYIILTTVVFPMPWIPLTPTKNGGRIFWFSVKLEYFCRCKWNFSRMKLIQCWSGFFVSIILGVQSVS